MPITIAHGFIGLAATADGTVSVLGAGSQWSVDDTLNVGGSLEEAGGSGVLHVDNGGEVQAGGLQLWHDATIELQGTDSAIHTGVLLIHPGGSLTQKGQSSIIVLDGVADPNGLTGLSSGGVASIAGTLETTAGWLALDSGSASQTELAGEAASWSVDGPLVVGGQGQALLSISAQARLETDQPAFIARDPGGFAAVNIVQGGRWDSAGSIHLAGDDEGPGGQGSLTITTGGRVQFTDIDAALHVWADGVLNVGDGQLDVPGGVHLHGDATLNASGGNVLAPLEMTGGGQELAAQDTTFHGKINWVAPVVEPGPITHTPAPGSLEGNNLTFVDELRILRTQGIVPDLEAPTVVLRGTTVGASWQLQQGLELVGGVHVWIEDLLLAGSVQVRDGPNRITAFNTTFDGPVGVEPFDDHLEGDNLVFTGAVTIGPAQDLIEPGKDFLDLRGSGPGASWHLHEPLSVAGDPDSDRTTELAIEDLHLQVDGGVHLQGTTSLNLVDATLAGSVQVTGGANTIVAHNTTFDGPVGLEPQDDFFEGDDLVFTGAVTIGPAQDLIEPGNDLLELRGSGPGASWHLHEQLSVAGDPDSDRTTELAIEDLHLQVEGGVHLQGATSLSLTDTTLGGSVQVTGGANTIVAHNATFDGAVGLDPFDDWFEGDNLVFTGAVTIGPGDGPMEFRGESSTGTWDFQGDVAAPAGTGFDIAGITTFHGQVAGAAQFPGEGAVRFLGGYVPGDSPARIEFGGDVILGQDNMLLMELAGLVAGDEHDQLDVAGLLALGGTLEVVLLDGFEPGLGDVFNLFAFGQLDGLFDHISLPELEPGLQWHDDLASTGAVTIIAEHLLGDMNLDGVVDTGDVAPFVLALTDPKAYMAQFDVDEATMTLLGDINQDGAFDTGDVAPFVQLLVGGGSQNVPEPGTLALLGLGGLMLLWRRRCAA